MSFPQPRITLPSLPCEPLQLWKVLLLALTVLFSVPGFAQKAALEEGQKIAREGTPQGVAACIGCHGAKGEGMSAFPRLAATGQAYLQAQLDAFADGSRKNAIMQPIASSLSAPQRQAVSAYFSQLAAPFSASDTAQPSPTDSGAWLATRGRWNDQLPACAQCHGPGGSGVGTQFPPLAGLPASYIIEQLQAWKSGQRPGGPLSLMPEIANKLSDTEAKAVAAYYEKLAGAQAKAPTNAGLPKKEASRP